MTALQPNSSPRRNTLRQLSGSLALPLFPSVALGWLRPCAFLVLAHRNPPAPAQTAAT